LLERRDNAAYELSTHSILKWYPFATLKRECDIRLSQRRDNVVSVRHNEERMWYSLKGGFKW
jgi:hypothetical protein